MKKKLTTVSVFLLLLVMVFGTVFSSAYEPFDTYTYDIDGEVMLSPAAFTPGESYNYISMGLHERYEQKALNTSKDICSDVDGNVYIADTNNHRIVILDRFYHAIGSISTYVDEYGRSQALSYPEGVFVTNETISADGTPRQIYVCDTGNKRVVVFDQDLTYSHTIERPDTPLLTADAFVPTRIAVDLYGKIYIISSACSSGLIVLTEDGSFTGFIGGNKITGSAWDRFWRRFQSTEQRRENITLTAVPVTYSNITCDDDGFIYVTTSFTTDTQKSDAKKNLTAKKAVNSAVKKLNSAGAEIMKRNGFFDPSGEVALVLSSKVSNIVDIAIGPEGTWSILDAEHSRVFTYDSEGDLLFAFGDKGNQLGNGNNFTSLCYQPIEQVDGKKEYYLLVLERSTADVNVIPFVPTDYYDTILAALANQNAYKYSESIDYWQQVLRLNNNFDLAYIGIGKALYGQERYTEAMEMLERAYETDYWSKSFSKHFNQIISKWMIPIVIAAIVVIVLIVKFLGWAKRKNKAVSLKVGRKTYGEELLYSFHLVFHPFDGFWDLKHEKRGSVRAALTIMLVVAVTMFYNVIGVSYAANPRGNYVTILAELSGVFVLVLLWTTANWCLTTLFDGEGSFKDVFVATAYSIAPMATFYVLATLCTHIMTDGAISSLLITIGYVWCAFLLFFGMLTTHDYSIGKNLLITICTLVAMIVIMFGVLLFSSLCGKIVQFVISIFQEIGDRL